MEGGRQQNYWPGFVDALSNLVLTLVFVMVIFILAMFYLSTKVAQGKMEALCPDIRTELAQARLELEDTRAELQIAQKEVQELKKELSRIPGHDSLLQQRTDLSVKQGRAMSREKISTETTGSGPAITVRFATGIVELDDAAKGVLDKVLASYLVGKQPVRVVLNALPGPETYSEGRRLSFFRAVAVRNYLIGKGVNKNTIESKVAEQGSRDAQDPDGRVIILLQRAAQ